MKSKVQQGNWWNDVAVKHSVILDDFKRQMESRRLAGQPVNKFVYNVSARLAALKAKNHVNA